VAGTTSKKELMDRAAEIINPTGYGLDQSSEQGASSHVNGCSLTPWVTSEYNSMRGSSLTLLLMSCLVSDREGSAMVH
jgi:hypothetical protein